MAASSDAYRVYILGLGNVGQVVAHALRISNPDRPITLLFHRASRIDDWNKAGQRIKRRHYSADIPPGSIAKKALARPEVSRGFDVEVLPQCTMGGNGRVGAKKNMPAIENLVITTKAFATATALGGLKDRLGVDSTVVLMQNGMGTMEEVNETVFADGRKKPAFWIGITQLGAYSLAPFETVHYQNVMHLGPENGHHLDDPLGRRLQKRPSLPPLIDAFSRCESLMVVRGNSEAVRAEQVVKFAVNCVVNPLTALLRIRNGELLQHPTARDLMPKMMQEIGPVVRALLPKGMQRDARFEDDKLLERARQVAGITSGNVSSMLQDVRIGNKTEVDYMNGFVVKKAEEMGLEAGINRRIAMDILYCMHGDYGFL